MGPGMTLATPKSRVWRVTGPISFIFSGGLGSVTPSFLGIGGEFLLGGLAGSAGIMSMYEKIAHECVRKKDERGDQVSL